MSRISFAVGLIAVAASFGLRAQSVNLQANIPFDFRIDDTLMPAGEYQLHYSASILVVKQQGGSYKSVTTLPIHAFRMATLSKGTLLFNQYGDAYFFKQVWAPGSREGLELLQSSRENRIAKNMGRHVPQNTVTIETN
jgi:hypothetical protein